MKSTPPPPHPPMERTPVQAHGLLLTFLQLHPGSGEDREEDDHNDHRPQK